MLGPSYIQAMSVHDASLNTKAAGWAWILQHAAKVAEAVQSGESVHLATILKDMRSNTPMIRCSVKAKNPVHNLHDVEKIPVVPGREILVETAYVSVSYY